MKALTLTQPWASLVMEGAKRYETRSWATSYRGPLAVHAAKGWSADDREFADGLMRRGVIHPRPELPRGVVLGIVELVAIGPTDTVDQWGFMAAVEWALGDFADGRFAWELRVVEVFPEPIPARGALGLWEWERPA